MCWVWLLWLDWPVDCEPVQDDPDEDDPEDEPVEGDDVPTEKSGIGISGGLRRSWGMSGGGIGDWPLISSGPLAVFSSVDHPPLPRVEPMLHDTWRLPASQLGRETVL